MSDTGLGRAAVLTNQNILVEGLNTLCLATHLNVVEDDIGRVTTAFHAFH